tara:strand:+ start:235 stop:1167 length:933 start_codon:yes stop_codon:yes gene_type:complete
MTHELGSTGLMVSPVGLGTVEIGLAYDIEDASLPSETEAETILKSAIELGITYIDTARGYGLAEERIGKSGIAKQDGVVIGTKCGQFLEQGEDPHGRQLAERIHDEVTTSLKLLQTDSLQLVQLHGGSKEQIERGELVSVMQGLKEDGLVQHVGIAVRGEEAAQAALDNGFFETVQLAHSILDQRMAPAVLSNASAHNIGVINRSVLLKGALTPKRSALPDDLAPLVAAADAAEAIATAAGLDLPTLALRFVFSNPAVTTALIGTIKPHHLESALAAAAAGPLPDDIISELQKIGLTDPKQVDPSNWPTT